MAKDELIVTIDCSQFVGALRSTLNAALDELERDMQRNVVDAAPAPEYAPRFDALGRQRWAEAEQAMAENAEHLGRINSRIGRLAYFRDEPPPGGPAEGQLWEPGKNFAYDQWVLNTQSMHDGVKHNSAYLFAKNAAGQYEANEALVEKNGHVATVCFQSRAAANEHLAKWIATQLTIGPRDPNAPSKFTPDDPGASRD